MKNNNCVSKVLKNNGYKIYEIYIYIYYYYYGHK